MLRFLIAIRIFFATLFRKSVANEVKLILGPGESSGRLAAKGDTEPKPKTKPKARQPRPPMRSEAVTLLETLQREARFVDFIKESLAEYSDAQIGAVAREVHRDCGQVIERLFAVRPLTDQEDGAAIETPAGYDPGRYRLTGKVGGEPPFSGRLCHHGWEATSCELPNWSGSQEASQIVAPIEMEVE